jgi:hypothetical protein
MANFKKTIDGREFIFEYLLDKSKNIIAYLGHLTFEMETDFNANWKITSHMVPRFIKKYEDELSKAIDSFNQ